MDTAPVNTRQKREPAREQVRTPKLRPGEALGRDGQVLRRNRNFSDQFSVPEHWKEKGWSYQWNRYSVWGKEDHPEMIRMQDNGWRPVPAQRFGLDEGTEFILRDGLMLMERPEELTRQAQEEEDFKAKKKWLDSFSQFDSDANLHGAYKDIKRGKRIVVDRDEYAGSDIPEDE